MRQHLVVASKMPTSKYGSARRKLEFQFEPGTQQRLRPSARVERQLRFLTHRAPVNQPLSQNLSQWLEPKWLRGANFSSFRAHESQSLTGETKPTGYLPFGKVVGGLLPPIPPASRVAFTTRSTGLAHQCTEVLGTPVHWLAFLAHQSF